MFRMLFPQIDVGWTDLQGDLSSGLVLLLVQCSIYNTVALLMVGVLRNLPTLSCEKTFTVGLRTSINLLFLNEYLKGKWLDFGYLPLKT